MRKPFPENTSKYLLLKFDVCSPSITGDIDILKLVILLTLSRLKMIFKMVIFGQVKHEVLMNLDRSRMIVILISWHWVGGNNWVGCSYRSAEPNHTITFTSFNGRKNMIKLKQEP